MYADPSGAENGSYSLTFLGKKVGRSHSVAPAGKQHAWETSRSICPEDPAVSKRPVQVPTVAQVIQDLPGTVTDDMMDHSPSFYNTHFDQCKNSPGAAVIISSPQLRRGGNSTKSN